MIVANSRHHFGPRKLVFGFGFVSFGLFVCVSTFFLWWRHPFLCESEVLGSFGGFFKVILWSHIWMFPGSTGWLFILLHRSPHDNFWRIFSYYSLFSILVIIFSQQDVVFKVRFHLFSFYFRIKIQKFYS